MGRLGLFGGTFDPVHNAHLRMSRAAAEQCGLDRVLLIPAGNPPHRQRGTYANYEDRFAMVTIACADEPLLEASRLEAGDRKSYSVETVERVRASEAPARELYFLIGADAFAEIRSWSRWRDLARMVTFAVAGRPGAAYEVPEGVSAVRIDGINLTVSSSEIRAELSGGRAPEDLPPGVLDYIRARGLYLDA